MRSLIVIHGVLFCASGALAGLDSDPTGPTRRDWTALTKMAWRHWHTGEVEAAHRDAKTILDSKTAANEARHLLFLTSFVKGDYSQAVVHHNNIDGSYARLGELNASVVDAYLHLGRYGDAERLARAKGMPAWRIEMLAQRKQRPLKATLDDVTVISFAEHPLSEYLPGFEAWINGEKVTAHIDTGGTFLVMGTQRAQKLGIDLAEGGKGYHGANQVDTFYGMIDSFDLGDATLENVPVDVLPSLTGPQDFIIFGTNVLQQFLSTLDYPSRRLILSPRRNADQRERHLAMLPTHRARMPFYMWGDHYMFARGAVGGQQGLNFFIDSGLVSLHPDGKGGLRQAAFTTSKEKFLEWGFTEGEMSKGPFESRYALFLGSLKQDKLLFLPGQVGARTFGGVRIDALLSHAFLKRYAWTLDFTNMEYIFSQPPLKAGH